MGLFGSQAPVAPGQQPYSPSGMSVAAQMFFGGGTPADAAQHLRDLEYERQMRPIQMQALQGLAGMFGSAPQYQTGPDPSVSAPPVATASAGPQGGAPVDVGDLSGAMGAAANSSAPAPAPVAPPAYTGQLPQLIPGTGPRTPSLSDPMTQRALAMGTAAGLPQAKGLIDLLDKSQPHVIFGPDGTAINDKSAANVGRVFPKAGEGQIVTRDANGNPTGIANLAGYSDALAQNEGAKTSAQEIAKAPWNLIDVPQSDGSTIKMPLAIAAPMLAARFAARGGTPPASPSGGGIPQVGGGDPASGPAQFGVSQTPAAAEIAKARAATQGKNETDVAGARSAMQQVDDQTNMIAQNLHDMLGETQDARTGKWVKTKPSMIGHLSTGSGTDVIEHIPFLNQDAKDLEAKIETVRNGTSFNSLQAIKNAMAAAGDGGSGSIRMTDQTARMLGEINGSLNQDQRGPQFEATVRRHLSQLDALSKARHDLFESQYQGIRPATPGQTGPTANYNKPSASNGPVPPAPRAVEARAANTVYQTPKGPLKWTGTGWVQP